MIKKLTAELIGTFWLVLAGCGSAVLAAKYIDGGANFGIGFLGVGLAFGLVVMTMAYSIGHISGCHLNPAVSIGLCLSGRFSAKELLPYIMAQVIGAIAGAALLYLLVSSKPGFDTIGNFASNGYDALSPGKYPMWIVFITEAVMTFMFLFVILGSTHKNAPAGFAPLAIGLGLTVIHLISIPISNTSVNPARSLGTAIFADGAYINQVWLFWVAPILGAAVAGIMCRCCNKKDQDEA